MNIYYLSLKRLKLSGDSRFEKKEKYSPGGIGMNTDDEIEIR